MKESRRLRKISKTSDSSFEEFEECIADLLQNASVRSMESFVQHSDINCLEHCMNVSYNSFLFCRLAGLNYRAAARGALLHDFFLYDWHVTKTENGLHAFSHPYTALKNANDIFELDPVEKDIIVKHMWPLTIILPRHMESLIVCFLDKLCALTETVAYKRRKRIELHRRIILKYCPEAVRV